MLVLVGCLLSDLLVWGCGFDWCGVVVLICARYFVFRSLG